MSEDGYKIKNKAGIHFVTFAEVVWVGLLQEKNTGTLFSITSAIAKRERGYYFMAGA